MSAWIVSKAHIDALVQSLVVERVVHPSEADEVGRELWRENLRSVAYRYPNDGDGQRPGPIDFRDADVDEYRFCGVEAPLDDLVIAKNLGCYDYQSCEHPAWDVSHAKTLCDDLAGIIAARRGSGPDDTEWWAHGDDDVPWGIDSIEQAIAKRRSLDEPV